MYPENIKQALCISDKKKLQIKYQSNRKGKPILIVCGKFMAMKNDAIAIISKSSRRLLIIKFEAILEIGSY